MDKTLSRSFLIISSLLLIFSFALPQEGINKEICPTKRCLFAAQDLKQSMNISVDPCDNFYLYACGNWPSVHKSQSTLKLRNEENEREILDFLQQENTPCEPKAVHKARKFFSLCLNEAAYTGRIKQIENILHEIGLQVLSFKDQGDFNYATTLATATRLAGVKVYFDLGVTSNPYNRTQNLIGLKRPVMKIDARTRAYSEERIHKLEYISEIIRTLCQNETEGPYSSLIKDTPHDWLVDHIEKNNDELSTFMKISTLLPKSNPGVTSLQQLQAMSDKIAKQQDAKIPKLNWTRYIEEMFHDREMYDSLNNMKLNLSQPLKVPIVYEDWHYITNMMKFIYSKRKNLMSIEWDIWWQVVSTFLPYVGLKISDTKNNINFFDEYHPTRERRCAKITSESLPIAISYGYSMREKYTIAKTKVAKIFEDIRGSFKEMIHQASWMDGKTKQRALKKLQSLKSNIAYPSIIDDRPSSLDDLYRDVKITDNFFDTMVSNIQTQVNKTLSKLNHSNDLNEESWTPPNNVNGFYDQSKNTMTFPAGLLGGSIYTGHIRALVYGAIGSIIGHELTHAFDEKGRFYNETGNIENWWQRETLNLYNEKAKCFVKEINSTSNLNEDIIDNAAFKGALLAYRKSVSELGEEPFLPQFLNFTHEQLLTLAYANVFCENPTDNSPILNRYENDSPNEVRVNGVLKNSKEFSEIWNCPKDSQMNPSNKCLVW